MEEAGPGAGLPARLIERIHAAPAAMVMEFAGAGSLALHWLHAVAGSSRTILEASDRYAPASLSEAIGFVPQSFTSPEVAAALALAARLRARKLASSRIATFGLGLTATIATDRAKRGEHRAEIAAQDDFGVCHYGLRLAKGRRERAGEEAAVSRLALRAIADASGVLGAPLPEVGEGEGVGLRLEPGPRLRGFAAGGASWMLLDREGRTFVAPAGTASGGSAFRGRGEVLESAPVPADAAILSGSFNPVHSGHLHLAEAAERRLGVPVLFEIPLVNADKAEIGLFEARRRALQFLGRGQVLLTRAPLFTDKARLFPGRTFVVGIDTAVRLLEARFYESTWQHARLLDELRELGARFLVAGRRRDGTFLTLADMEVPAEGRDLFEELPEEAFREDLSSSQLREGWPDDKDTGRPEEGPTTRT